MGFRKKTTSPTIATKDYYDAFSMSYEHRRHAGYHAFIDDLQADLVKPYVPGKKILEVGCGTGLIMERLAPDARQTVGIDLSPEMLKLARAKGLNVTEGTATDLPFDDGSFDLCYSFKVLSHVPELATAISEMARVTREGGHVFIELYNRHSLRYLARLVRGGATIARGVGENQVFYRFYSVPEMVRHLPDCLVLEKKHGVRIFTLLPSMMGWPLIGRALKSMERRCSGGVLARLGGFCVLHCRRC